MVFELTGLHVLHRRQLGLGDVILIHVEEDILDHDYTHFLVTPGPIEFNKEGVVVSAQNSLGDRAE